MGARLVEEVFAKTNLGVCESFFEVSCMTSADSDL